MNERSTLTALKDDLVAAIRFVAEGEGMIARHREILEILESEPEADPDTILRARNVLASLEAVQARRIANRDKLRRMAESEVGPE